MPLVNPSSSLQGGVSWRHHKRSSRRGDGRRLLTDGLSRGRAGLHRSRSWGGRAGLCGRTSRSSCGPGAREPPGLVGRFVRVGAWLVPACVVRGSGHPDTCLARAAPRSLRAAGRAPGGRSCPALLRVPVPLWELPPEPGAHSSAVLLSCRSCRRASALPAGTWRCSFLPAPLGLLLNQPLCLLPALSHKRESRRLLNQP